MMHESAQPQDDDEGLAVEQVAWLHQRQAKLQQEARQVVKELRLNELLSEAGHVRQVGSSVLGLMIWRDIDFAVSSPGLSIERVFECLRPLYTEPRIKHIRYTNESGHYNLTGQPNDERYYFALIYDSPTNHDWKLDISFWLGEGDHPEPVHEAIAHDLTPDTRQTILWIKQLWYQHPAYRHQVFSTDIYNAVLYHGVRTPAEFDLYLASLDKPTRV